MKSILAKVSSSAVVLSGLATSAFAASDPSGLIGQITGVNQNLDSWAVGLVNWAIGLAAVVSVVMLIAAGYMYITANGDENKVEKATKTLTGAIIGLVICFIAVMLVQFVLKNFLQQ